MCVAALLFQYGYETIKKCTMPTEGYRVLSDEMWESLSESIGSYHTPTIFQSNILVLLGYFQKSAPLMKHRKLILKNLNRDFKDNYGLTEEELQDIYTNKNDISLVVIFGSPYIVNLLPHDMNILIAYEENEDTLQAVEDFLRGTLEAKGKLPITIYSNDEIQTLVNKT